MPTSTDTDDRLRHRALQAVYESSSGYAYRLLHFQAARTRRRAAMVSNQVVTPQRSRTSLDQLAAFK